MSNESVREIEAQANAFVDEYWNPSLTVGQWWAHLTRERFVNMTLPVEAGGKATCRAVCILRAAAGSVPAAGRRTTVARRCSPS